MADTPIPVAAGALSLSGAAPTVAASTMLVRGDIVMPLYVVDAAIDQGLFMPMMTMDSSVLTGEITNVFQLPLELPFYEVAGTILEGTAVDAEMTMPLFEVQASSGSMGAFELPLYEVEASGVSGVLVTSDITVPLFEVAAVGQHTQSSVDIEMPLFVVDATLKQAGLVTADIILPMITAVATIEGGQTIVAALTLPMMEVEASIYGEVTGTADLELPLYKLEAEMFATVDTVFRGYVMNVEIEALTTYSNFNFNSFAKVGDSYFGASEDGIFELAGDTDNTAEIAASMTFKNDNFGSSRESRVVGAYLSADLSDDMRLGVIANGNTYLYEIAANGERGLVNRRIDTIKGERAIYWQTSLLNVGGADFKISAVEVLAKKLARRI